MGAFQASSILSISLALTLLWLPGCQKRCKPGDDASCWIAALNDPAQVDKAVVELKSIGDKKAEPALIEAFKAGADNPKRREEIAEIFQKWRSQNAVKPMLQALDYTVGPDKDGRKAKTINRANQKIASALGAIGDRQAVGPLIRLMKVTKNPYVKRASIRALGLLKATDAVDELLAILADATAHKNIRANAIHALGDIGDPKAVAQLVLALYQDKAAFFVHANLALVKIGEPAVDPLIATLNGKNREVKRILESNVEALSGAMEANAAQVLGDIGSRRAVEPLLELMSRVARWDSDNKLIVMVRLISALGDIGDRSAVGPIAKYLETKYWDVNTVVAGALTFIGDRSVVPLLIKQTNKAGVHPRARVPLIEAVGNLGTAQSLPKLEQMKAKHKDRDISRAIDQSLKRLQAQAACQQNADCWIGKLKDPDAVIREKAAYELGQLGEARAIDSLIEVIDDDSELVRWGVIFAFDKLNSDKPLGAIEELVEKKEKGSRRFRVVNNKYKRLIARLKRTAS